MSIGNRAATCTSCSKRLTRKSWYYRNGKFFCKRRCWVTESVKAADAAKAAAEKKAAEAAAPAKDTAAVKTEG